MINRRYLRMNRKYMHSDMSTTYNNQFIDPNFSSNEEDEEVEKIPLPNEVEKHSDLHKRPQNSSHVFFRSIFSNIQIDDIILIGLLILLFYEGLIDEFLIISLIYLLMPIGFKI